MRYITISEALGVYERVMDATGGLDEISRPRRA